MAADHTTTKTCTKCRETKPRADFYKHGGKCRACVGAYTHARYLRKRDEILEYSRQYRKDNAKKIATKDRSYYLRNRQKIDDYRRLWKYGVTPEQFQVLHAAQSGRCAVCRSSTPGRKKANFHVDHDHETGKVRGLLCGDCNTGLGLFKDNQALLAAAAAYLRKHKATGQRRLEAIA